MGSSMPDYGRGLCEGHHEVVDFGLRKNARACVSLARLTRDAKEAPDVPGLLVGVGRTPLEGQL